MYYIVANLLLEKYLNEMSIGSVLVTGANRGIGLEFVRQLLALQSPPKHIIASCRNPDAARVMNHLKFYAIVFCS